MASAFILSALPIDDAVGRAGMSIGQPGFPQSFLVSR
jgi:hypothetical protein